MRIRNIPARGVVFPVLMKRPQNIHDDSVPYVRRRSAPCVGQATSWNCSRSCQVLWTSCMEPRRGWIIIYRTSGCVCYSTKSHEFWSRWFPSALGTVQYSSCILHPPGSHNTVRTRVDRLPTAGSWVYKKNSMV
jgi:hypothetical protein